jgi:hypothetical protein
MAEPPNSPKDQMNWQRFLLAGTDSCGIHVEEMEKLYEEFKTKRVSSIFSTGG